jgi:superfamily II DNA or RNA helicase
VEEVLGGPRPEPVPPGRLRPLLAALRRCEDVRWEGRAVEPSPEPVFPWAVVEDAADGWRIRLVPDPELTRVLGGGLALCGDQLRPIGESRLTAAERQRFARGAVFPRERAAELVGEVLPRLESRIPVLRKSRSLPGRSEDRPRLLVELERDPDSDRITARPYIVYGDPPVARVAGGDLEHLRGDVPMRDPEAERRLEHRLGAAGLGSGLEEQARGDEGISLVQRVAGLPAEIVGMRPEHRQVHDETLEPSLGLAEDGSLRAGFATSGGRATPEEVVAAWRRGREYAPLLEGRGWARLPREWLARHGERLADLLAGRDDSGRLKGAARVDACGLLDEIGAAVPEGDRERRARLFDATGPAEAAETDLPRDLRATLRGYQRDGVRWLTTLRRARLGALLADDMGLGKTLQVIASLPESARCLVACPTSVIHEWREQIARFRPGASVATYHGPDRHLASGANVTLTSYALLRIDAEALAAVEWDVLVLDEAQAVKNPESQVARAARRLPASWKVALTGTPMENRLEDLWSQMAVLNPGLLGSRRDFERRYARPISNGDEQAAARLNARLRPFVLRRTKSQVAPELPERTEVVRRCVLSDEEREIYEGLRAATRNEVVRQLDGGASALGALEALLRLRQAACHPALLPGERWVEASTSSKVDELLGLLDTVAADGHRALIFSQWTTLLDLIEPPLRRAGHTWLRLDGSTADREDVVSRFQDPQGPPFLLISLKAGGTGLNLTAADHVVLLDPWWNPAVEDQAADRAHRIGRTRPVIVHRLVASETVEERLLALQQEKRAVASAALGGAAGAASLTREDLLSLLS